jgi:hypothetical protein
MDSDQDGFLSVDEVVKLVVAIYNHLIWEDVPFQSNIMIYLLLIINIH